MPEPDDELTRLHAADPIDPASLPSATDLEARALLERITMTEPTPSNLSRHRPALLAAAAAVLVLVTGAAVAVTRDGGEPARDVIATPTTLDREEPISPGGSTASCVETYDLTTLTRREMAFDGTVAHLDGDDVTFTVNHWYRGRAGDQVTLSGAATLGGRSSAGSGVPLEPGSRLLVAGDGGFAWSCGFTQPYDPAVAEEWEDAFGG